MVVLDVDLADEPSLKTRFVRDGPDNLPGGDAIPMADLDAVPD